MDDDYPRFNALLTRSQHFVIRSHPRRATFFSLKTSDITCPSPVATILVLMDQISVFTSDDRLGFGFRSFLTPRKLFGSRSCRVHPDTLISPHYIISLPSRLPSLHSTIEAHRLSSPIKSFLLSHQMIPSRATILIPFPFPSSLSSLPLLLGPRPSRSTPFYPFLTRTPPLAPMPPSPPPPQTPQTRLVKSTLPNNTT